MGQRLDLHAIFKAITSNVYHQPPPNHRMEYPCIVYMRNDEFLAHANDLPYKRVRAYQVTIIDSNPDSTIPSEVAALPMCKFDRHFTADQLNHDVYTLYF